MNTIKRKYDVNEYKFKEIASEIFDCDNLNYIHVERRDLLPVGSNGEYILYDDDGQISHKETYEDGKSVESDTKYDKLFYKNLYKIQDSYDKFIENEISSLFDKDFLYQKSPTFRVHLPADRAIHKWHCDSQEGYNHPDGEINFQITFTGCSDTSCMWVESEPGKKDFKPIEQEYGEFVQFNGNKCTHGNKINNMDETRISIDFRILPLERYDESSELISAGGTPFKIGDYYRLYKK